MPTIAIDYTPAVRQSAGIGRIVRGQVDALVALNRAQALGLDLRLFVAGPVTPADRARAPLPLHAAPISERNLVRLWHRLDLPAPRVAWFTGGPLDLFHAADFTLAPSGARRTLLTVHDLAFLFFPDAAMPSLHRYLNVVVPRSVYRASHVAADSHHTARDLCEQWGVAPERITVVQGAVDHARFRSVHDPAALAAARARYGIGEGPFIFTLSRLEPRKNHVRLVEAFARARAGRAGGAPALPHRLVIGGGKGWLYEAIFAKVEELKLGDAVHFTGFVDDADLPALYSAADFFAYPSLYEGFGLPVVEALACGLPVLAGDNSCLPEAGGPGALYVDALDVDAIAAGLARLAADAPLRAALRAAGLAHAARFTWERSAGQLLAAYAAALGEPPQRVQ